MQSSVIFEHDQVGAMPLLIARPQSGGPFPLIVALHGFTGNKETMLPLIEPLAAAGFVVAAPDAMFHGARLDEAWMERAQTNEAVAIGQSVFATAAELPALLDALLDRPDARADATHGVGVAGVSMGALTLYAAIPLEPRFSVAVSLIGGGTWGNKFDEAFAQLAPDARANLRERDIMQHLDAFARITLLLLAGELDPILPAWTTQAFHDALRPRVPDPDRLRIIVEPGVDHTVTPAMGVETIAWFRRWLR